MFGLPTADALFYIFSSLIVFSAILVVFLNNPVFSALFLALTMTLLGFMFFTLDAYFVAAAQITVYAGAVMVLFIMVIMLFDLQKEHDEVLKPTPVGITKIVSAGLLCGFLMGATWLGAAHLSEKMNKSSQVNLVDDENAAHDMDEEMSAAEQADLVVKDTVINTAATTAPKISPTKALSALLFSKYVFGFEALSLVLLSVIVGAVALARSKGGTHHVAN